jgi:hypothetical protein
MNIVSIQSLLPSYFTNTHHTPHMSSHTCWIKTSNKERGYNMHLLIHQEHNCWGLVQIIKIYYLWNPKLPKIYLCSNVVMINGDSVTYPCRPNAWITLSHKRWRWRRCSRPQGREDLDVVKPVWQHRHNDLVPHVQHLVVLVHVWWMMNPFGSRI